MLRILFSTAAVLVVALPRAQTPPAPPQAPPIARGQAALNRVLDDFDRFNDARLTAQGIVGASIILLHDHRTLHQRAFGFADLAARRPVDADTIFHWASITTPASPCRTAV
jgi:CubicO group peptidase (beta-lactamase class C family)